jgi:hypothetical protein
MQITLQTGRVTSKLVAARWGKTALGGSHPARLGRTLTVQTQGRTTQGSKWAQENTRVYLVCAREFAACDKRPKILAARSLPRNRISFGEEGRDSISVVKPRRFA